MEKLYILDAVNILFRSYYAIGPMTNPKGESTNALYGFIRSLQKIIKDFSPTHLVAVFDGPDNKRRRTDLYSEYKSHRVGMPEDLFPQLERAVEFCEIAQIPFLSIPGVEADDTMGSIAKWAEEKKISSYLCTSDKDLCQLVSDHIFVINIHKDNRLIDREGVKEIYGVTPEQMVDYLAMVGDASDNIPGLEGFGPKTAASLLGEMGSLDNILAHPEQVSGKKKQEILSKDKDVALLSRQLATIYTEVDFPKNEKFFALQDLHTDAVKAFYQEMHFLSLVKAASSLEEEKGISYLLVDEEEQLEALLLQLGKEKEICLDTETTSLRPMEAHLVGVGLGLKPKMAWYIPLNGKMGRKKVIEILKPLFENKSIRFFGHNIKYDLHVLLNEGIALQNICFDTLIASYLLNPQNQRHNLDQLAFEKFEKVKIPIEDLLGKGKKQIAMDQVPIEKVAHYCCEDVDYTCRLKILFEKELRENQDLLSVFENIELPLISILTHMERDGIYLDVKKLEKMSGELKKSLSSLQHLIYELAGESFNLNSPKQLSTILFEKLGIKPLKKTMTGFSTSADVLDSLQESEPIIKTILEYRTLEKLRSTYVDSLPQQVFPKTHRIHCTFNQSVAATGRLSCQDPNLQNIPVRSPLGREIREAFKPQQPHWSFLSADYSQIELRLLAHLSNDPSLIKAFNEGEDIHAFTASLIFNVPLKQITPELRYQAKAVNFGILYGQQAFGLSQGLNIDFSEAAAFIDTYFQRYKSVKDFFEFCKESVRKTGRAVTLTGRQRPIADIHSKNPSVRAAAERLAMNTPLQGTAADLIKIAMIQIHHLLEGHKDLVPDHKNFYQDLRPDFSPGHSAERAGIFEQAVKRERAAQGNKDGSKMDKNFYGQALGSMILQIHDELLFESPDAHIHTLASHVKKIMESVFTLKVPLEVDISIGKNWGEC